MHVKHTFVSAKADGADSTVVRPLDWNADHDVVTTGDNVVLGRAAGVGAGPVQELPISSMVLPGFVQAYAGATTPTGWLLCNGAVYNRADYVNLFVAIGTVYNTGGESGTQFRVPDLRGRVIAMVDGGTGRLTPSVADAVGAAGGARINQVRHNGSVDVSVSGTLNGVTATSPTEVAAAVSGNGASGITHSHNVTVSGSMAGAGTIRNNGTNITDPFSIVQATLAMNYLIKT